MSFLQRIPKQRYTDSYGYTSLFFILVRDTSKPTTAAERVLEVYYHETEFKERLRAIGREYVDAAYSIQEKDNRVVKTIEYQPKTEWLGYETKVK